MTMDVARRIDEAVRKGGVISTVCFRERYRPIFMEAKRLLAEKEVVHIRFQSVSQLPSLPSDSATWSSQLDKGGTSWFDWGPHAVDYSRYMSDLDVVKAQCFSITQTGIRSLLLRHLISLCQTELQ